MAASPTLRSFSMPESRFDQDRVDPDGSPASVRLRRSLAPRHEPDAERPPALAGVQGRPADDRGSVLVLLKDDDPLEERPELPTPVSPGARGLKDGSGVQLLSPHRCLPYNGSIDTGIGSLTPRTTYAATRNDRPGDCNLSDVQEARQSVNIFGCPRDVDGPSPTEGWNARSEITLDDHRAFPGLVTQGEVDLHSQRSNLTDAMLIKSQRRSFAGGPSFGRSLPANSCWSGRGGFSRPLTGSGRRRFRGGHTARHQPCLRLNRESQKIPHITHGNERVSS